MYGGGDGDACRHLRLLLLLLAGIFLLPADAATATVSSAAMMPSSMWEQVQQQQGTAAPTAQGTVFIDGQSQGHHYFVTFDEPAQVAVPHARYVARRKVEAQHKSFHAGAEAAGIKLNKHYAFSRLVNAVSISFVEAPPQGHTTALAALRALPGVVAISPVRYYAAPQAVKATPPLGQVVSALTMSGAYQVQQKLGLTGKGIKVGLIDTGVDFSHPALGGCFGHGCKVAYGYDLVGDDYGKPGKAPSPGGKPSDCVGHGTHTSGIIAAKGFGLLGTAPDATLGMYRVFGCTGGVGSDVIVAALERAHRDGMHIINLSLGSGYQWPLGPDSPDGAAAGQLVAEGVIITASAGNDGLDLGLFGVADPSVSPNVISVASIENTKLLLPTFQLSGGSRIVYMQGIGVPKFPTHKAVQLVDGINNNDVTSAFGCHASDFGDVKGKAPLVAYGACTIATAAANAQAAGAVGVVFYSDQDLVVQPKVTKANKPAIKIPLVMIYLVDGTAILQKLGAKKLTALFDGKTRLAANPIGQQVSDFTSWGPNLELDMKPDLGAPGGSITSTWLKHGQATLSGTSMAAPSIAGICALILQAHPGTKPAMVLELLQNSAVPVADGFGDHLAAAVNIQGAGLVDAYAAIKQVGRVVVTPSKLSVGAGSSPFEKTLTIHNYGSSSVTYALSHLTGLSQTWNANPEAQQFVNSAAGVSFTAPKITVPPKSSKQIHVTITPPAGLADLGIYGGYLVLTAASGSKLRVPFVGLRGNYQDIELVEPGGVYLGLVNKAGSGYGSFQDYNGWGGLTFDLQASFPAVVFSMRHGARWISLSWLDATTGRLLATPVLQNFASGGGQSYTLVLDSVLTVNGKKCSLPNGSYVVLGQLLKPLGKSSNPEDVEYFTAELTVQRAKPSSPSKLSACNFAAAKKASFKATTKAKRKAM